MKFSLTFKTPDVADQIDDDEEDGIEEFISQWIEYGEYITIDFDSNAGTAKVRKV
jgi:hypothetical protein